MHLDIHAEPRSRGVLLSVTSIACTLIALWLVTVLVTIVPVRDPARVPLWSGIAVGFVVLAAAGFLAPRLGRFAFGAGLFAAAGGAFLFVTALLSPRAEDYVFVMGLAAMAHGVALLRTPHRSDAGTSGHVAAV